MKVLIIATGEVLDLDAPYAVRLIEQRQAVLASSDTPVTPEGMAVDIFRLNQDAASLNAITSVLRGIPSILAQLLSQGKAAEFFKIGDEIIIPWADGHGALPAPVYNIPFVVVDIADAVDPYGVTHENAIWLMAKCAVPLIMPFSADGYSEVTEETAQDGWYYFKRETVVGTTYVFHALNLETGDAIPTGITVVKYGMNLPSALKEGYPRWSHSVIRQWLNSDAGKNVGWWTSQHNGDQEPVISSTHLTNYPGWINGFSSEWKALFKPVRVQTTAPLDGNRVTDITYDTFFLPSTIQMGGVPNWAEYPDEGDVFWPYWREKTGLAEPSNSQTANRFITAIDDTDDKKYIWLRSVQWQVDDTSARPGMLTINGQITTDPARTGRSVTPVTVLY